MGDYERGYLVFMELPVPPTRKTRIWNVTSTSGSQLGEVRWYARWRCYCFSPVFSDYGTVFNAGCLNDLAAFCDERTKEHRSAAQRPEEES